MTLPFLFFLLFLFCECVEEDVLGSDLVEAVLVRQDLADTVLSPVMAIGFLRSASRQWLLISPQLVAVEDVVAVLVRVQGIRLDCRRRVARRWISRARAQNTTGSGRIRPS